jgi:hypothetical protein
LAAFEVGGAMLTLQKLEATLKEFGQLENNGLTEDMLRAGGEVYREKWIEILEKVIGRYTKTPSRSTGALVASITTELEDRLKAKIGPDGYDPETGVPNAIKAYMLQYGNSNQQGTRFRDIVHEEASNDANRVMGAVLREFLIEKGLI